MIHAPRLKVFRRLGSQLAFVLATGLLPLTVISMVAALRAADEIRARSEAALTGDTMLAAGGQVRMIQEARGSAAAIAGLIGPLLADDAACSTALRAFAANHPDYSQVSFFPLDGQLRCSSSGKHLDLSESPVFRATIEAGRPKFSVNPKGPISGVSVLGVSHPVRDRNGTYLGYVGISLPHSTLSLAIPEEAESVPLTLITFDRDGTILTSDTGLKTAEVALPLNHPLTGLMSDRPIAFSDLSREGQREVYSVVPIVEGELYALGAWPADRAGGPSEALMSIPFFLPALIWLVSVVAAWLSVEWLVNRHIRRLNHAIKSFAGGSRMQTEVDVTGAPLEIREIAAAFERMTDAVMRDEAELEDALHQKELLLHELHHRVKNNLQMIASMMNLQGRKARSVESQQVIRGLQGRVMSLATIHRELYQTEGLNDVQAAGLLGAIARQTVHLVSGPDRRFDLRLDLEEMMIIPDQAVPLGLLVGEGLTIAAGLVPPGSSELWSFDLRLRRTSPETALVEIEGLALPPQTAGPAGEEENMGLSLQLMTVLAQQMGGTVEQDVVDGTFRLRIRFRLRPFEQTGEDPVDQIGGLT